MNDLKWSKTEKKLARDAFDKAYARECAYLAGRIREMANAIRKPEEIWDLHDFLAEKLKEIEDKYDYRYSMLILVFARLVKDGWLKFEDLAGIAEEKFDRIKSLLRISDMRGDK